jgi:hypothetical protein
MKIEVSHYKSELQRKLKDKNTSLQFLPRLLFDISAQKTLVFRGVKIKTSYLIDLVHTLMLKYYFKGDNNFALNAIVLKEKYGYLYKLYIDWLLESNILILKKNYRAGITSRCYKLNPIIFKQEIKRVQNPDKFLIKKYRKRIFDNFEPINEMKSSIGAEIRQKLISDLFSVDIDIQRSRYYLNSLKNEERDSYNRNLYSIESINEKHLFYHFDNYGRLHTNFTILKSFIRKNCLTIDGEPTFEIDIKNSQPLFLWKLISQCDYQWIDKTELDFFKILTLRGKFYEYWGNVIGEKNRNCVKQMTYKVLFGHNRSNSKADKTFSGVFPTIHQFIKFYKKECGSHKILAHDLQKAESNLIFNNIIRKINLLHPEIKIVTVHDSLIFQRKWQVEVNRIFQSEINREFDLI